LLILAQARLLVLAHAAAVALTAGVNAFSLARLLIIHDFVLLKIETNAE
jgi:hypothetical protein